MNPFVTAYRVVCKRISAREQPKLGCPVLLRKIISTLFPRGQSYTFIGRDQETTHTIPEETGEDVLAACTGIGDRKTSGSKEILNRALKTAIRLRPDMFVKVFHKCFVEVVFPRRWTKQKLVLIPKPDKPPGKSSSYRPVCLLDTMVKILERIIYNRLLMCAEAGGALSGLQYEFRKGRSPVDAIRRVVHNARDEIEDERCRFGPKEYCAVVTLDVRNAFNSANNGRIMREVHAHNWSQSTLSPLTKPLAKSGCCSMNFMKIST